MNDEIFETTGENAEQAAEPETSIEATEPETSEEVTPTEEVTPGEDAEPETGSEETEPGEKTEPGENDGSMEPEEGNGPAKPMLGKGLTSGLRSGNVTPTPIDAAPELTITATAGTVYSVTYGWSYTVDIYNNTGGSLLVNTSNEFDNGKYITIPEGAAFNGFCRSGGDSVTMYISAEAAGDICLFLHSNWR